MSQLCGKGLTQTCFLGNLFIDMHDIDSPDKSAFCPTVYGHTVNIHVVDDVAQTKIIDDAQHTRSGAKKRISIIPAFLN